MYLIKSWERRRAVLTRLKILSAFIVPDTDDGFTENTSKVQIKIWTIYKI